MNNSKERINIKFDRYLINRYDQATTYVQQRGWVPLNTIIMANTVMFWGCAFSRNILEHETTYLPIIFGSVDLTIHFMRWKENQGYWENQRKTQALNAEVVAEYDRYILRHILTAIVLFLVVPSTIVSSSLVDGLLSIVVGICLVSSGYLRCCRYIGPGDYARKRQAHVSGSYQGV